MTTTVLENVNEVLPYKGNIMQQHRRLRYEVRSRSPNFMPLRSCPSLSAR